MVVGHVEAREVLWHLLSIPVFDVVIHLEQLIQCFNLLFGPSSRVLPGVFKLLVEVWLHPVEISSNSICWCWQILKIFEDDWIHQSQLSKTAETCESESFHPSFVPPQKTQQRIIMLPCIQTARYEENILLLLQLHQRRSILHWLGFINFRVHQEAKTKKVLQPMKLIFIFDFQQFLDHIQMPLDLVIVAV